MSRDDASANEHRLVEMMSEVGDGRGVAVVFVAERKKPKQIAGGVQSVFSEHLRARRTDAFEELDVSVGGCSHASILRASATNLRGVDQSKTAFIEISPIFSRSPLCSVTGTPVGMRTSFTYVPLTVPTSSSTWYSLPARITLAWRRETERLLSTGVRSMSGIIPVTGSPRPIVLSSLRLKKNDGPLATSTPRTPPPSRPPTRVHPIPA